MKDILHLLCSQVKWLLAVVAAYLMLSILHTDSIPHGARISTAMHPVMWWALAVTGISLAFFLFNARWQTAVNRLFAQKTPPPRLRKLPVRR